MVAPQWQRGRVGEGQRGTPVDVPYGAGGAVHPEDVGAASRAQQHSVAGLVQPHPA
ncbi:hypothetical protein [Streptomyces werraensis]|uniref:hypothetical protein n=1 Tax=Streptomyces werraensis TaxID=68284 RepID=UPI0037CDE060